MQVDIITDPGLTAWQGSTSLGLRGDVLNARNAFAPVRTEEEFRRFGATLSGPLVKGRTSLSGAPAVVVIDAFTGGGAATSSEREVRTLEIADDVDFSVGRHSHRVGVLFEASTYRLRDTRDANGTFTFGSLDAFLAGRPTTFSQRLGTGQTSFTQYQLGLRSSVLAGRLTIVRARQRAGVVPRPARARRAEIAEPQRARHGRPSPRPGRGHRGADRVDGTIAGRSAGPAVPGGVDVRKQPTRRVRLSRNGPAAGTS
ncbi:MAG: hypothetical protein HY657_12125 [Acidobacteria bacterium]|nr:hypothetical protein [Acidobacteriota bacterium]